MSDPHQQRAADALGPELAPGESMYGTFDDPRHYHNGHQDTYLVTKDQSGNVTTEKQHVDDAGRFW